MATGNTFILKSSEKSPLSLAAYGNLINEAGFPPGVINIITGAGPTGSLLASHMKIDKIAFTGSSVAGRAVMAAAAKSNLKHVSLELGGKSPALIFDDADLDNAVEHSSTSFLRNSGQICFAASRVLVQENIAPKFIEAVKTAFENAAKLMGDPNLEETAFGPLADKKQFERVMSFLDGAKQEGVQVLVGGERKGDKGTFVRLQPIFDVRLANDTGHANDLPQSGSKQQGLYRRNLWSRNQHQDLQDRRRGKKSKCRRLQSPRLSRTPGLRPLHTVYDIR